MMKDACYDPLFQVRHNFWRFRWAPIVRDQERRQDKDEPYFAAINISPDVQALTEWIDHGADQLIHHPDAPLLFRFRVWRIRAVVSDQLRKYRNRPRSMGNLIFTIIRIVVMIMLSLTLLVEPEYVAIRLKERTFNVRSVPAKLRTAYLMVALMFFAHPTVQLLERLAEDRLFSPLVSVIAFNPPAFDPALANLYGSPKYTRLTIGLSFAWLFCLSFGNPTLKLIEALWLKPTRCTPAFLALAQTHRARIEGWTAELFYIIDEHPDVSRFTAVQNSDLSANFGDLLDGFESILDEKVRFMVKLQTAFPDRQLFTAFSLLLIFGTPKPGQKLALGGRLGIIAIALLTGIGAVLPYKNSPFVLGGAVVWAAWCCGRIILLEASPYQAVRAGLDLYGLLLASSVPAIFSVGIPIAFTDGHVLDANWAFAFEMTISAVTTFLLTDITAPAFLKFGEMINLIEKVPNELERESCAIARALALESPASIVEESNPPVKLEQTVDMPPQHRTRQRKIQMEDPRTGGAPGNPLEAEPFEINFFSPQVK